MSRRNRRINTAALPSAAVPATIPLAASASGDFFGGLGGGGTNGHQGAESSRVRGYVYFPELDTRREISSYTRLEMLRKSRFLYANYGIAKRIVNGLARMVAGTGLTPQATTTDKEWNARAEKAFAARADSRFVYDVGGRYNFYTSQAATESWRNRDGDCAEVLARSESGGARFAFYEGHQVGNLWNPGQDQSLWTDGVRVDRNNAAVAYRFLGDNQSFTDIPAQNVIFNVDYERGGQSRGLTILSHAINHLLDAAEIVGYVKQGVKLANRFGYWIERAAGTAPASPGASNRTGGAKSTVTTPAGAVTLEKIYGPGAIPDLQPGESLKFASSSHPHPNNLNLLDYLIRDVAWGAGVSPEVIWNIAALGGANTRFVLADAQGFIEQGQQRLVDTKLSREWIYIIALELKAGRLRPCRDPEWWKHAFIPPPRLTVDFGRDGKMHLEQIKAGALTFKRYFGWQGLDSTSEINTWLDEMEMIRRGCTENGRQLDPAMVLSCLYGRAGVATNAAEQWATPGDPAAEGEEEKKENASDVSAILAELAKNPTKAQAVMQHLARQPEAA